MDPEERKRQREEKLRALQEEEKRLEEERNRRREERKKAREEEQARLDADLRKHEVDRKLRRENSINASIAAVSTRTTPSDAPIDPELEEIVRQKEERKKRLEDARRQREEEAKREEEERARRTEERRKQQQERLKALEDEAAALLKKQEARRNKTIGVDDKGVENEALNREAEARAEKQAANNERAREEERAREAQEKAAKEANETAIREAEKEATKRAEEKAAKEAEDNAERTREREAEEKALREAEEKVLREVEERTLREAEEKALTEAEEKALREAEEKALREAEEKAAKEASEKAIREAEKAERAREEEEAAKRATEQAKEAEERAAEEAKKAELAREEAEQAANKEREREMRLAAERAAREAEEEARRAEENAAREREEAIRQAEENAARETEERLAREETERVAREAELKFAREAEEQKLVREAERVAREAESAAREAREAERVAHEVEAARLAREAEEAGIKAREIEEKAAREVAQKVLGEETRVAMETEKASKVDAEVIEAEGAELIVRGAEQEGETVEQEPSSIGQHNVEAELLGTEHKKKQKKDDSEKRKHKKDREEGGETKEERRIRREERRKEKEQRRAEKEKEKEEKEERRRKREEKKKKDDEKLPEATGTTAEHVLSKTLMEPDPTPIITPEHMAPAKEEIVQTPGLTDTPTEGHSMSGSILLSAPARAKGLSGRRPPTRKSVVLSQDRGRTRSATIALDRPASILPTYRPSVGPTVSILSVASQAYERQKQQPTNTQDSDEGQQNEKKKYIPPGAVGIMGLGANMATLALEAQKRKKELAETPTPAQTTTKPQQPSFGSMLRVTPGVRDARVRSMTLSSPVVPKADDTPGPRNFRGSLRVTPQAPPRKRLIHCKGKKRIHIREADISVTSLNKSDVFVLDCGIENVIYVWSGPKSSPAKRTKGAAVAEIIKNHERNGAATIIKLDFTDNDAKFWATLKGTVNEVKDTWELGDDLEAEKLWTEDIKLYQIKDTASSNVQLELVPVSFKQLSMDLLSSDGYFVLDCGVELYFWVGKLSDQDKRLEAMSKGEEALLKEQRPKWVEMSRIAEGGEPVLFREKFVDWPDLSHEVCVGRMGLGGPRKHDVAIPYAKRTPEKMTKFEVKELLVPVPPEMELKSDGRGDIEVWRIAGTTRESVLPSRYGHFHSGHTYIVTHTHVPDRGATRNLVLVWQGVNCPRAEAGTASLLIKEIVRDLSKSAETYQEVMAQHHETLQFLTLFQRKLIIHKGEEAAATIHATALYHVHGYTPATIHAIQVNVPSAAVLNSRDAFILLSNTKMYIWTGCFSSDTIKTTAQAIGARLQGARTEILVSEGNEPEEFWAGLGGKLSYADSTHFLSLKTIQPRFFVVLNTGSIIRADEAYEFQQVDLAAQRVVILDTGHEVYVWTGLKSPEKEKKRAMEIALEYAGLQSRSADLVFTIKQGEEPVEFTAHFHAWDIELVPQVSLSVHLPTSNPSSPVSSPPPAREGWASASPSNSVVNKRATFAPGALSPLKVPTTSPKSSPSRAGDTLATYHKKFPLSVLQSKDTPPEVDRALLEKYLSDEDFASVFNMTPDKFDVLPAWKRSDLKKKAGLF